METIVSSFAVVLDEMNDPPQVYLFHVNNEYNNDGKITQPAGWKLPGGRYEKLRDETPRHTAKNETQLEIGINIEVKGFFQDSMFGEAILEKRKSKSDDKTSHLEIYTFFMKRIGNTTVKRLETKEGGASGSFSLKDILLMPLACTTAGKYNPYGIQFTARKRIFTTLKRGGCDFLELIPDLPEFFDKLDPDEVGEDVYWILKDILDTPESEIAILPEEETEREPTPYYPSHEKICPCDSCWQRWWAMVSQSLINT